MVRMLPKSDGCNGTDPTAWQETCGTGNWCRHLGQSRNCERRPCKRWCRDWPTIWERNNRQILHLQSPECIEQNSGDTAVFSYLQSRERLRASWHSWPQRHVEAVAWEGRGGEWSDLTPRIEPFPPKLARDWLRQNQCQQHTGVPMSRKLLPASSTIVSQIVMGCAFFLIKRNSRQQMFSPLQFSEPLRVRQFILPFAVSVMLNRVGVWMNYAGFWDATGRSFLCFVTLSLQTFVTLTARADVIEKPLKNTNAKAESPWKTSRNGRQPSTKPRRFLAYRSKRMKGEYILYLESWICQSLFFILVILISTCLLFLQWSWRGFGGDCECCIERGKMGTIRGG